VRVLTTVAALFVTGFLGSTSGSGFFGSRSALAQQRPAPRVPGPLRFRISANLGAQATSNDLSERQNFDRYFEQGSFTLERTIPKALFYDVGGMARVWRGLHGGYAISLFEDSGTGSVTADVPHPLQFNRPRTTEGDVSGIERRETGHHISAGWLIPSTPNVDFMVFGGPSIFVTEQTFVTGLTLSLSQEVFPFDSLTFPGAQTEIHRENIFGYHLGVDMMWRFTRQAGVGLLLRYTGGKKDLTPTGGQPVEINAGGLHAGGGVRLLF
jgi:hypothetical protein